MDEEKISTRRTAALKYIRSNGKKTLRQIADEVGVPVSTIKSWKRRDKWDDEAGFKTEDETDNATATNDNAADAHTEGTDGCRKGAAGKGKANTRAKGKTASRAKSEETNTKGEDEQGEQTKRRRGGQPGSRNAYGNRGGGAPIGNRNAVSTGAYEKIMYATLTDDEKELLRDMPLDRDMLLIDQIRLLTIREKRMFERIEEVRKTAKLGMIASSMRIVNRGGGGVVTDGYSENVMYMLNRLEEALTKVQQRKQAAIDALHRYSIEDERFMPKGITAGDGRLERLEDAQIDQVLSTMSDEELRKYAADSSDYNSGDGEL